MCRLLFVRSQESFNPVPHLQAFAEIAQASKEYQGHGWGCAYLIQNEWYYYKNIKPIWEDDFLFLDKKDINLLLVHARSAFQNEGIIVENNMPFHDENSVFIFNGELHGVKIKEQGRIGAEKIYNYIKRFIQKENLGHFERFKKGVSIIQKRTEYIRGMNIIFIHNNHVFVSSSFSEDPKYFSLHFGEDNQTKMEVVCSQPYNLIENWTIIENNSFLEL